MQDPSAGVQAPLEKHVHLLSGHRYPFVAHLSLEQAFKYLLEAPTIVKQVSSMSWQYIDPPADGTIWLEWMSPRQNGGRYPSDGYVWGDHEQPYHQEISGYTVELMVHQFGFRPGVDHLAEHARTRYHLIAKAPNVSAAPPDPSLWIVHYHHAQQQRVLPVQHVPFNQEMRQIMTDRQWLQNHGRIERREFMLHDREHWPTVTLPGSNAQQMRAPGMYGGQAQPNAAMMAQARYGQAFPQQAGPPSAKRQRTHASGFPGEINEEAYKMDEEEYLATRDYFDLLTPQQISLTRYQQHHQWMEEVFSSPYASANIVPVDLGLGLMGELKGLTDGILEPPAIDSIIEKDATKKLRQQPKEVDAFTNLKQDQIDEFNNRVRKHLEEGRAEIERIKADHISKMKEWRTTNKITQAEQQLRNAPWNSHESALYQQKGDRDAADIDDVVKSIEQITGLKIKSYQDASLVEKGGLEEEQHPAPTEQPSQEQSNAPSIAPSEAVSFQQDSTTGQDASKAAPPANGEDAQSANEAVAAADESTGQDFSLDGAMDLDNDLNFDLGDTPAQSAIEDGGNTAVNNGSADVLNAEKIGNTNVPQEATSGQDNAPTATTTGDGAAENTTFNESTFDFENEIGNTNDDVGDGLIDFDGNDGMEDSAFGDAMHGMDTDGA